ncbi:unnamed protein product [Rotaria sp. Silwood1]|nr:unnamed protein product [Rotaria sp. Silwood1]CAF1520267.1 unnamed protein product [Rotaria sp. Silwood1]CAF3672866.1 unnamed protein product [Rotaria sp. Silwood1]CAF3676203.1 unnamed protein product [Rotaria sp. Silwood1]CAF3737140.1 unnamed protein product [Rotaria sp. Silwood1]
MYFDELQRIKTSRNCRYSNELTNDPNLGPLPPSPGEEGSQVPPNWQWKPVLVDDLSSDNADRRNLAERLFQKNTIYSILFDQESQARNEYEAKEREHIRHKQIQYNENMKKQWKKDRMDSLPSKCIDSRR